MEALHQPEYVHVLLNHLPITGLFAALLCLIGALVARERAAVFLGMGLVSLFSFAAWPVSEYGERGYDRVYAMADADGGAYLKRHRELAENWTWLFYATGAGGVAGIAASWKWPRFSRATGVGVALLAASSLAAGAVIADCGGKVRHREFRSGPPPTISGQNASLVGPVRIAFTRRVAQPTCFHALWTRDAGCLLSSEARAAYLRGSTGTAFHGICET